MTVKTDAQTRPAPPTPVSVHQGSRLSSSKSTHLKTFSNNFSNLGRDQKIRKSVHLRGTEVEGALPSLQHLGGGETYFLPGRTPDHRPLGPFTASVMM